MDRKSQGHRRYNRYPTHFPPLLMLNSLQSTRFSRRNQTLISSSHSIPELTRHDPSSRSSVPISSTNLSTSRTCMAPLVPTPISRPLSSAKKLSPAQLQVRLSFFLLSPLISPSSSRQGACSQGIPYLANVRHRRHLIRLLQARPPRCRNPEADKDE